MTVSAESWLSTPAWLSWLLTTGELLYAFDEAALTSSTTVASTVFVAAQSPLHCSKGTQFYVDVQPIV